MNMISQKNWSFFKSINLFHSVKFLTLDISHFLNSFISIQIACKSYSKHLPGIELNCKTVSGLLL